MIHGRVEKLKFIVEEMHIAFCLAMHLTDPFIARTLARHILVRAENFIEHARGLRRPLNDADYDTRDFHKTKEAYASAFDEYFKVARHRLGAHVQDFDFGKRIELWNDIEIVKISFFVEGAQEIYRSLAPLNLPGYIVYAEPPELTNPDIQESLRQYQRVFDNRNWIEMGVDPLALTRNNTAPVLNATPVHARAGQLALIRRWIAMQNDLLQRLVEHVRIARILKGRIVTDIVSFCDCLVTRPVSSGALQAMDGLDKLIVGCGQSSAAIDNFVDASNFQIGVQAARTIRDKVGAHIEIDETHTLTALLADLDAYDLGEGLNFYERVGAAFTKACHSILFLRLYAADGQRLYGVSAGHAPAVPYAGDNVAVPPVPPAPPPINDEEAYRSNLTRWLDGDDAQKGDARLFFWHAFADSQATATIEEVERFGSAGQRMSTHDFRKAHQFLCSTLSNGLSDFDFKGVLELILSCRSGWPYPLAEILVRHGRDASVFRQWLICYALGEIGSAPHASVCEFLETHAYSHSWPIRLQAALARFKTFVKAEGTFRLNHKEQTKVSYDSLVDSLLTPMSEFERLICLLGFASILSGPGVGSFSLPFQSNYAGLQIQIEALCVPFLKSGDSKSKAATLKQLIQTNDYVGVCVLVALECDDQNQVHIALIENCCNGSIVTAGHDQATRHLAMCFLLKKEHHIAFDIVQGLASRNPDSVEFVVLAAEILGETLGAEEEAMRKIDSIRHAYKITPDIEMRLNAVETEIGKRS
ncbi:hypothetical protein WJ47_10040 [Burkholderia ubonensis]|uniref:Uncharacterized protein n=2 Tax=Burkholderia ubonensis TaxID=101571 RepID=A0AB73FT44_9BURK|nr:hypothetical protein WJ38_31025 [Burkholderia ubonensis]KVK72475.1 hypothetical protein WJ44_02100 [Burkholderia ubonensis]KVL68644.1 hypothetical protein WJ47_10040 [Burkholderia ubonensis]KVM20392.1 hypothetical protein WJ53_21855 [Burkholderia ubonensis]